MKFRVNEGKKSDEENTSDSARGNDPLVPLRNYETDLLPSRQFKRKAANRMQLPLESLDFSFFDRVYASYNTIWPMVVQSSQR